MTGGEENASIAENEMEGVRGQRETERVVGNRKTYTYTVSSGAEQEI